jgi:pre-mRNA-splicing factor RBM22/SLT11
MQKTAFGDKLCKISNIPYQGFKWKAGPGGRYKETIICYTVAAQRNICQTCLNDMVYGLPVGVRDAMLAKPENQIALPQSIVGQQYFYEQQAQMVANGEHNSQLISTELANVVPNRQLDQLSRIQQFTAAKSKTAFRNLPKLCSFWLNGSCTRVLRKTCPFRPCCGTYVFPEIIGSDRELCQTLVAQLEKEGPAAVQTKISAEVRAAFQQSWKGVNRDDAIRKRVNGDDDLTQKYLGKMKTMVSTNEFISLSMFAYRHLFMCICVFVCMYVCVSFLT